MGMMKKLSGLFILVVISLNLLYAQDLNSDNSGKENEWVDEVTVNDPDSVAAEEIEVEVAEIIIPEEIPDSISFDLEWPSYEAWNNVVLAGKLKMKGLPLSPSVRIYMKRDSLIDLSLRAPFMGEVGRMQLSCDSVIAVNKVNKTYIKANVADFLKYYPGGIGDVQDLLLGRFFLPGIDLDEVEPEDVTEIFYEDGQYNVVPIGDAEIAGIKYGFVVDEFFNPLMLIIIPENRENMEASVIYEKKLQGYDLRMEIQEGNNIFGFTLELKDPEWGGEVPKNLEIGKKLKEVTLSEFLKF